MDEHLELQREHLRRVRDQFVQRAIDEEIERLAAEGGELHELWHVGLKDATEDDAFETNTTSFGWQPS